MPAIIHTFPISIQMVDPIADQVQEFLQESGTGRETTLRLRLAVEEVLLRLTEHFSENTVLELSLSKKMGVPCVRMRYRGVRFDPVENSPGDEIAETILKNLGIRPVWSWRSGVNEVSVWAPVESLRSEVILVGAVVLALILGAAGSAIPAPVRDTLVSYLLQPLSNTFMKLLSVFSGMLVFLSILSGIFRAGSDFNRLSKYVLTRYFSITIVMTGVFAVALIPFFRFAQGKTGSFTSEFDELYQLLLDIVPGNLHRPFLEANMMQIVLLAVIFGVIFLGLGNRVSRVQALVQEVQMVFMNAVELVCKALPVFVFTSLLALFWENGIGTLSSLWRPILACVTVQYAFVALLLVYVSAKFRMPVLLLAKKIFPVFLVGITTASSLAAFGKGMEVNKKALGIREEYSNFAYPLGISMYLATYGPIYLAIPYYLAELSATPVSPVWFIVAGLTCVIVSYATPQVSGGALICLGIMMAQLGIPQMGLAVAGTLALVLDFFTTGSKVVSHHLEMILQADHLGFLDRETLTRP